MERGCDYSWARPSPSTLAADGYHFVARYLSYDTTGKNLTSAEAQALTSAGLSIVSNWENGAMDALDGYNRGAQEARDAQAEAAAAGAPAGRPIYFSIDFDATAADQPDINDYFDGVASVIGRARTGAYGGYYVIKRLFDAGKITWGWQTYAWSGGQWDPRAQLWQTQNGLLGGQIDEDYAQTADFGQWGQNRLPRGYLDAAQCDNVAGWAQDQDHPDQPVAVRVYFDGKPGQAGAVAVTTTADVKRQDLCKAIGSCNHGFSIAVPAALRDGAPHTVNAYGIDLDTMNSAALADGGKTVTCAVPVPSIGPDSGVRRHITSPDVMAAWGLHSYDVVSLPDAQVDAYPDGDPIDAAPELVEADGDPAIYVVDGPNGDILRHVINPASMAAWHFSFADVKKVSSSDLANDTVGAPWPAAPFVLRGSGPAVYVLDVADPSDVGSTPPIGGTTGPGDAGAGAPNGPGGNTGPDLQGGCSAGGGGGGMAGTLLVLMLLAPVRRRSSAE